MPSAPLPRALQHLTAVSQAYPKFWRTYERLFEVRGRNLPDWPRWCYCPLAGAYGVVSAGSDSMLSPTKLLDVSRVGALAAWRPTKGIYRFDRDLGEALVETPLDGELPHEVLQRLPEWCVYVETSGLVAGLHGFFAHLEWDANDGRQELRLLLDRDDGLLPIALHLVPGGLVASIQAFEREALAQWAAHGAQPWMQPPPMPTRQLVATLAPLVSLLLYLCSESPDYGDREPPTHPSRKGHRTATEPRSWDVGVRIGAALRGARERPAEPGDGTHARPRPHVRAAHWHLYWTGPKTAPQKPALRWLSPILVGVGETVATVRTVKG